MGVITVPFGEFLPSAPTFQNPGCVVADGVIPSTGGYKPFPALTGQGDTVTGDVLGAEQMFRTDGSSIVVGGTSDRLFVKAASVAQTTGLTAIGDDEAWDFCRFNDFVIATAPNNSPQYLSDIDSDTTWSALTGSPPEAKRCARVGDFVMLGNLASGGNKIRWSHFNAPASSWAVDRLTQAGEAAMPSQFGDVQRIIGGRYALVFQERGIQRLSYVGPPSVWRADEVSGDRGTIAPYSVINIGYQTFFLAQDGFYVTNGSAFQQIGSQRVNDWFFETAAGPKLQSVHAAVDWVNGAIVWAFQSAQADSNDRLIIYSWEQQRWSTATVNADWLVGSAIDGIDIDSLDAIYSDLDSVPVSLDSVLFQPGERVLGGFVNGASTSEYALFNGDPMQATWETGEFQPSPGQRVFVNGIYPLMEADTWDMQASVVTKDNFGMENASPEIAVGWGGFCPVRGEGQKARARMIKPAGSKWGDALGVQVSFDPAGMR